MSLFWKIAAVLAVSIVFLQLSDARHTHLKHVKKSGGGENYFRCRGVFPDKKVRAKNSSNLYNDDVLVYGQITCKNMPLVGGCARLLSDEYNDRAIDIAGTDSIGQYRLTTAVGWVFTQKIWFVVYHQCDLDHIAPMKNCAVPYFKTQIKIDVNNNTKVNVDMDLHTMEAYTNTFCL